MKKTAFVILFLAVVGFCIPAMAAEVENEDVVQDTETDGEVDVPDQSLEADSGNSGTALSADAGIAPVAEYDTYDGTISTTYTTYFGGVVDKLTGQEYVLVRSGQYEYTFVYGDLELSGTTVTGSGTVMQVNTYQTSAVSISEDNAVILNLGSNMAYSSLGSYPALAAGPTKAQFNELLWLIIVIALVVLISGWFGYGLGEWRIWKRKRF